MAARKAVGKAPVSVDEARLEEQGFTASGIRQYCETVIDYAAQLLERSLKLGDAHKARGLRREITHDHVKATAHLIARSFGAPRRSRWLVAANVTEYVATAVAGLGAGRLDHEWGVLTFGVALSVAVVLVVVRLTAGRGD